MPSQQEVRWSQLKIGVIVLVSVVILTTLLFLMTSSSGLGLFTHKLTVMTYFENSAGLKEGAAVNLQGVTIGQVKAITVSSAPDRKLTPVQVVMQINTKYQSDLHTDSTAALITAGVLGDEMVDINSQLATGPPLQDGATLNTLETPNIQDVVKESQGTIENLNTILAKLNTVVDNLESGKGSFGQLLTNPDLYNKFVETMSDVQQTTAKLNSPDNTLGKFLNDKGQMYDRVDDALGRVDDMTKGIQAGKGTAGKLLTDDRLYNNLNKTVENMNLILADAQAGKGGLGILLKDPKFAQNLSDTMSQANQLMAGINQGKGSLGKILNDDTAYTNLNGMLIESTKLVTTIRQDPKKYLTIHLKIF